MNSLFGICLFYVTNSQLSPPPPPHTHTPYTHPHHHHHVTYVSVSIHYKNVRDSAILFNYTQYTINDSPPIIHSQNIKERSYL